MFADRSCGMVDNADIGGGTCNTGWHASRLNPTHSTDSLRKPVVQHGIKMQQGSLNQFAMTHLDSKVELCAVGWLVQAWQHLPSIGLLQQVMRKLC